MRHFVILAAFALFFGCKTTTNDFRLRYRTRAEISGLTKRQVCLVLRESRWDWPVIKEINVGNGVPMKEVLPELSSIENLAERPTTIVKLDEKIHYDRYGRIYLDRLKDNYEERRRTFEETIIVPGTLIIVGPMR